MNVSFTQTVAFFTQVCGMLWTWYIFSHLLFYLLVVVIFFIHASTSCIHTWRNENDMDKYYSQVKLLHNQIFFQKWFSWSTVLFFSRSSGIRGTGNLVALKSKHADKWDINISLLSPYKYWMPTLLQAVVSGNVYSILSAWFSYKTSLCKCM